MFKKITLSLILAVLCFMFSGCFDVLNLNENAYLLAVGIDKGVAGKYRFSLQFAQPIKSMGEDGAKTSKDSSATSEIVTIDASDIVTAIYSVKDFKSKRINGSHMKILVFGEEIAKDGICDLLASFIEPGQLRTNMYLAIARGTAADYLKNVHPQTEIFLTKFYERQFDPMHGINMTAPRLYDTYFSLMSMQGDIALPLVGVNRGAALQEWLYEPRGYISGDIPRVSENISEMAGIAYFKGENLQGLITQAEGDIYFLLKGVYSFGYLTVPDMFEPDKVLVMHMEQAGKPKIKMDLKKNQVHIDVSLTGVVFYGEGSYNYAENVSILQTYLEEVYTKRCVEFLNKMQREDVDILRLERLINTKILTTKEAQEQSFDLKKSCFYCSCKCGNKKNRKIIRYSKIGVI